MFAVWRKPGSGSRVKVMKLTIVTFTNLNVESVLGSYLVLRWNRPERFGPVQESLLVALGKYSHKTQLSWRGNVMRLCIIRAEYGSGSIRKTALNPELSPRLRVACVATP